MALDGVGVEGHAPPALTHRKRPGAHCTEDWEGLVAGLDEYKEKTFAATWFRIPKCQFLSLSLYRLPSPENSLGSFEICGKNRLFVATQICTV
jgi:hypothetical protein